MIFTDLDGTLIDHHSYDWSPARLALDKLRDLDAPVILASSKTAPEISALRSDMDLDAYPAIVENGAGLLQANATPDAMADDYDRLRAHLNALPAALRDLFTGFGDMSVDDVRAATGLDASSATLAKQRAFSEPGQWHGDDAAKQDFLSALREQGVQAQQGGRFLTLSFGATKADQVRAIVADFAPANTIALGDAPNDIAMLETTDYGVIIANPDKPPLPPLKGEEQGRITRTQEAGPTGWNTAIHALLQKLNLE